MNALVSYFKLSILKVPSPLVQLTCVYPPAILPLLVLTRHTVAPLLSHLLWKSLGAHPSLLPLYNKFKEDNLLLKSHPDVVLKPGILETIKFICALVVRITESLKKNANLLI